MNTIITKLNYENTIRMLNEKYESLKEGASFFAFYSTEYDEKGSVIHDFFQIINEAVKIGYEYVNTIVFPTLQSQKVSFKDNVRYVIWMCKNHSLLLFNKDVIREKHIWKDVEWGKREKNYNPKGKDPGNVWIPTLDDGKANIIDHIILSEEEVQKRLIEMTCCGKEYEIFEETISSCIISLPDKFEIKKNTECLAKVIFGSSEKMDIIKSKTVATVVTSPPYWDLKDYFKEGQIGKESYESYLSRMKSVWSQCYEKLDNNGTLWININIRVKSGRVILIPYDIIKMCKEIGFYYKGILIWHKSSGIPTGVKNIVDRHEYVLLFSKSDTYSVNQKKFSEYRDYKNDNINGGAFWNINRKAGSVGKNFIHPAIFPNALVERIILISSNEKSLIVDPFLGSGTSLISSVNANRAFIGYEFNEGFRELMDSRFSSELKNVNVEYVYV